MKKITFAFATIFLSFAFFTNVNATTMHVDETTSNSKLYGWLVNENYDQIILDSDVNLTCFSSMYAVNPISDKDKTIDLNGHTLSLGPANQCGLELNGLSRDGVINIIDSSENKTGVLANEIVIRNCKNDDCHNLTVNINGGTYTAPVFLKFANDNSYGDLYLAKDIQLNISNIKYTGELFFKNYSRYVRFSNSILKPNGNMSFTDNESEVPLSEVITSGYKAFNKDGLLPLTSNINSINLNNSNLYIVKDTDIVDMANFTTKNIDYEPEVIKIKLTNPTNDNIEIKSINIDNTDNFELIGFETVNLNANDTLETNYSLSPKSELGVGTYKTNIILKDNNGNLYADTVSFEVENRKITKPTLSSSLSFDYNGNEHEVTFNNFDENSMTITGNKATEAGEYVVSIQPKEGYCWNDGTTDEITYNWKIILVNDIDNLKIISSSFLNVNKQSQFRVIITPSDATYKDVTWSVENGTGQATIDQNGLLTAVQEGTVKVKVTANYDHSIFAEKNITINSENSIERIMITAPSYYLSSSSTYKLSASIYPTTIESEQVTWTSLDTSVATINQEGLLTPKKAGTVIIRATVNADSTVYDEIEVMIINPETDIIAPVGERYSLTVYSTVYSRNMEWIWSDRSIMDSITGGGYNLGKSPYEYYKSFTPIKSGYTRLDMVNGTTTVASYNVYAYSDISNIVSSYDEIILEKNELISLDIPSWYEEVSNESNGVYFTVEDSSIATIDSNGRIKALKKGNTNVIAFSKYNEKELVIPLSVVDDKNNYTILSEDITITGETDNLRVGRTFQYEASIKPTNTTNKNVTWSVENETGQATIDENGLLTAVKAGTVKVKATTQDGTNISKSLDITLKDYYDVEKIFIKNKDYYVETGKSFYMQALVFPDNATNKKVRWTSSNTTIATIDPDTGGLATNYKTGDVTITATATDGSGISGSIVLHVGYTNVKINETTSLGNSSYVTYDEVIWDIADTTIVQPTGQTGKSCITVGGTSKCKHSITVKGLKNGNTTVTMKTISGATLATSTVYVYTPISGLSSDIPELNLVKNETKKVNITITPDNISSGIDRLIYTSSDESVATVDQNGNITGLKNGNANIIVYSQYNNKSVTIPVSVATYSESLNVDIETLNLTDNSRTHQVVYEVLPEDAINKNVTFESADTSVATVSNTGLVTAIRNGTTTITVKTEDGRQTKTITVTVSGIRKDIKDLTYQEINNLVYNGSAQTPEIIIHDGNYKLVKDTDYVVTYEGNTNVGTVNVNIEGIGNFKGTKTLTFKITKATIEYTASGTSVTYDGNEHGINLNVTTPNVVIKYADNNGNYTLTSMPKYKNAGTYTIRYQLSIDDNYNTVTGSNNVSISKANINIAYTSSDNTVTYNGNEHGINLNVTTPNVVIKYADNNGNYTLTSMPKYKNAGTYTIRYQLSIDDNHSATTGANTLKINKGNYTDTTEHKSIMFDGNEHGIDLQINPNDYTARFSIGNDLGYGLTALPKFSAVGQYDINYRIFSNNYNEFKSQRTLTIYGVSGFDSALKLSNNILAIRDYNNIFSSLYTRIKFLANKSDWKHLNSSRTVIDNENIKTGDYVQLILNDTKTFEYELSVLGDVNGDGKISALDYVKIKNHIMKTSLITTNVNLTSADLNEDGKISALDYVRIKNYIMNGGK